MLSEETIAKCLKTLSEPPPSRFALAKNLVHKQRAKKSALDRRLPSIRSLIKPENARAILPHLPAPGERTEIILRGDFVLCDLIPAVLDHCGPSPHLRATTLGLSAENARTLATLHRTGKIRALSLVVSHYFRHVNSIDIFAQVRATLADITAPRVCRMHCKVILIPTDRGDFYCISGSGNLRSSNCLEQIAITNDRPTHDFHDRWIDELPEDAA